MENSINLLNNFWSAKRELSHLSPCDDAESYKSLCTLLHKIITRVTFLSFVVGHPNFIYEKVDNIKIYELLGLIRTSQNINLQKNK